MAIVSNLKLDKIKLTSVIIENNEKLNEFSKKILKNQNKIYLQINEKRTVKLIKFKNTCEQFSISKKLFQVTFIRILTK